MAPIIAKYTMIEYKILEYTYFDKFNWTNVAAIWIIVLQKFKSRKMLNVNFRLHENSSWKVSFPATKNSYTTQLRYIEIN